MGTFANNYQKSEVDGAIEAVSSGLLWKDLKHRQQRALEENQYNGYRSRECKEAVKKAQQKK